jgi:hypothetical protein
LLLAVNNEKYLRGHFAAWVNEIVCPVRPHGYWHVELLPMMPFYRVNADVAV